MAVLQIEKYSFLSATMSYSYMEESIKPNIRRFVMFKKLGLIVAIIFISSPVFGVDWTWMNPTPTLNSIFGITTIPGTDTEIIGGERGTMLLSDDHWSSWSQALLPDGFEDIGIRALCFTSSNIGYASTSGGLIIKTETGGRSWSQVHSAGQVQILVDVSFYNDSIGFVVGLTENPPEIGFIHRTVDGGLNWDSKSFSFPIHGVEVLSEDEAIAVCGSGKVLKTFNCGLDWVEIETPVSTRLRDVEFVSSTTGIAVGNQGTVIISDNGGRDWTEVSVPLGDDVRLWEIAFADENNAVAVGMVGSITSSFPLPVVIYTSDCGNTWSVGASCAPNYLVCVDYTPSIGFTAAGCWGNISSSSDDGATWYPLTDSFYNLIREITFTDGHTGFCVGSDGFIAKTIDGGVTWSTNWLPQGNDLFDVAFWNSLIGIAVGSEGFAVYTADGGETWNTGATPVTFNDLKAIAFVDTGKAIAVGNEGVIIVTYDNGANWQFLPGSSVLIRNLNDICFTDILNGYICGEGNTFLRTDDGGEHWESVPRTGNAGTTMLAIDFINSPNGYCAGIGGKVIRTFNSGDTWEVLLSGGALTCYSIEAEGYSDVAVSAQGGAVIYSNDAGANWHNAQTPTGAYIFSLFYSQETGRLFAAGGVGAILTCIDVFSSDNNENSVFDTSDDTDSSERITVSRISGSEVSIFIQLDETSNVKIGVMDITGRIVADLGLRNLPAGQNSIVWAPENIPAGVYLVFMDNGHTVSSSKLVLY